MKDTRIPNTDPEKKISKNMEKKLVELEIGGRIEAL